MSERIIRKAENAPGGFVVTVEVTEAYTDGSSRFDEVFVPRDELRGKSAAERLQAIKDAIDDDPVGDLTGQAVSAPSATKEIIEARMVAKYEEWQRWKTTRLEAQARSLAAAIVNALTAKEDAVWATYLALLQAWRAAP